MREKALKEFIEKLKAQFPGRIEKIVLFGSYVRRDYDEESDIDVLIVGELSLDDILDLIFEIMLKYGVLINAITESKEEFERLKETSFHKIILSEGAVLYEKT
ncbi:nucleotidyltransferase domain-containing protein [Thermococcus aggregans]|uniref:Nucleotidyltransferase domain-containing protein n=1 Tax=Thermococcus aggregans TaxID=110163 RepID=A0A9E7MY56_THEAG|nr:nucleotidyltransferase domain-containing protein [Thermococcus aggregans]USS41069.1 nucleotidyltransferase domain-containing protein [Thermococcus aggregans]